MQALQLVETTTPTQKKNGTTRWYDPITDMYYASYASGYVRRIPAPSKPGAMYPLNPRIQDQPGITYVLLDYPEDREELLLRSVANYRKTVAKRKNKNQAQGLGPVEQVLLNQLNLRAMLVVELEAILSRRKIPVNHDHLYQMEVSDLIAAIAAFSDK